MDNTPTTARSAADELIARGFEALAANHPDEVGRAKDAAIAMLKKLPVEPTPAVEPVHTYQPGR
ncbi:MAG: hypothetical protein ACKVQU_13635 [Burkholderiales bacterium]